MEGMAKVTYRVIKWVDGEGKIHIPSRQPLLSSLKDCIEWARKNALVKKQCYFLESSPFREKTYVIQKGEAREA